MDRPGRQINLATQEPIESTDSGPSLVAEPSEQEIGRDSDGHPEHDRQISRSVGHSERLTTLMSTEVILKGQSVAGTVTTMVEECLEGELEYLGNFMVGLITIGLFLASFTAAINDGIICRLSLVPPKQYQANTKSCCHSRNHHRLWLTEQRRLVRVLLLPYHYPLLHLIYLFRRQIHLSWFIIGL